MLNVLFERYKSKRLKYHLYYEKEFFDRRFEPLMILQVGIEPSLQVWQRYFNRSQIYCIDRFVYTDPKNISYLDEERIHWSRCDVNNKKQLNHVMIDIWKKPRFDIIIDNVNNFAYSRKDYLRRYCIGKHYIEDGTEVKVVK